ncbi:MAG TPA: acylphosphatase [Longimicrobiaceae bacterium]|nr:acylphosphatase [Longimicrobiaceae bacterium]
MPTNICREFRIHGHVQGVGFRWWTKSQAIRLGINGSVKNCVDGSVLVRACGHQAALDEFASLLRRGPEGARVRSMDASPLTDAPGERFIIER